MSRPFDMSRDEAELIVDLLSEHGDTGNALVPELIEALCNEFGMTEPYRPFNDQERPTRRQWRGENG